MERDERRARGGRASPDLPVPRSRPIHGGGIWAREKLTAEVVSGRSLTVARSRTSGGKRRDGNISAPKLFVGLGIALRTAQSDSPAALYEITAPRCDIDPAPLPAALVCRSFA